ncbi:hypothetical protein [Vulcanisaeta thermophila]|uniref:hypothetical protein n=1 Tax=Vulcanisaeta thermophila TaxID=867917 RepID=UPI000852ED1C|nr:hypothetical protein [Vulcanisaeta thermophila]
MSWDFDFYRECVRTCESRFFDDAYARKRCFEWCEDAARRVHTGMTTNHGINDVMSRYYFGDFTKLSRGNAELRGFLSEYRRVGPLGFTAISIVTKVASIVDAFIGEARGLGYVIDWEFKRGWSIT